MRERKITDEEVIRALERCNNPILTCEGCPLERVGSCLNAIKATVLPIINRQKAEIDDLKRDTIPKLKYGLERANKYGAELDKEFAELQQKYDLAVAEREANVKALMEKTAEVEEKSKKLREILPIVAELKTEAIKEFAERVKENRNRIFNTIYSDYHFGEIIDSLVKEITEGSKNELS